MVRIIERSKVGNKEHFDEIYRRVRRIKETDRYILVESSDALSTLASIVGDGAAVQMFMHNYCSRYPFTMFVSDKDD